MKTPLEESSYIKALLKIIPIFAFFQNNFFPKCVPPIVGQSVEVQKLIPQFNRTAAVPSIKSNRGESHLLPFFTEHPVFSVCAQKKKITPLKIAARATSMALYLVLTAHPRHWVLMYYGDAW